MNSVAVAEDGRTTIRLRPHEGSRYALARARVELEQARTLRLGARHARRMRLSRLASAGAYRREGQRLRVLETYGIVVSATDADWFAANDPRSGFAHTYDSR